MEETDQAVATEVRAGHDTSYDACPDFVPIVSLPELDDIRTGEEDEEALFSHRAKLYRFDTDKKAWKERGLGDMKILEHKKTGKARILMRREQVLKLCCNHYITSDMSLTVLKGDNQLAWFTHCDFAEGVAKAEKLAVKFKESSVAAQYRRTFEDCVAKAEMAEEDGDKEGSSDERTPSPVAAVTTESLREKFSTPAGSWDCETCLVQNQSYAGKCVACGTSRPGSQKISSSGIQFGVPSTSSVTASGGPAAVTTESLRVKFSAPAGSWDCETCLVQNQSSADKCVACGTSRPGSLKIGSSVTQFGVLLTSVPASEGGLKSSGFKLSAPTSGDPVTKVGEGGFKLGSLSLGAPPSSSSAPEKSAGGFKLGAEGGLKSSGFKFLAPTSGDPVTKAGEGGFKLGSHSLGAAPSSSSAPEKSAGGFKLGAFSLGALPSSATTDASRGSEPPATVGEEKGSDGPKPAATSSGAGFRLEGISFPSFARPTAATESQNAESEGGPKTEEKESQNRLKLEPFSLPKSEGGQSGLKSEPFSFSSAVSKAQESGAGGLNLGPFSTGSAPSATESSSKGGGPGLFSFGSAATASTEMPFKPPSLDSLKLPTFLEEEQRDERQHDTSAHEPDIHFEPVVTLPETVEIKSGEENEDTLFTERAKLFRFDSNLNQWKERGVGDMKILVNRNSGKARVLMRREQILKICCNHYLTQDMSLSPMLGSNKAWIWFTLCDFADETPKPEKLAARFKSPSIAEAFKKAFEEATESVGREHITSEVEEDGGEQENETAAESGNGRDREEESNEDDQQEQEREEGDGEDGEEEDNEGEEEEEEYEEQEEQQEVTDGDATSQPIPESLAAKFAPKESSWTCKGCYVMNQRDDEVCLACGQPNPSESQSPLIPTAASSLPPQLSATSSVTPPVFPAAQVQQQITFGSRLRISPHLLAAAAAKETSPKRDVDESGSSSCSRSPSPSPTQSPVRSPVKCTASEEPRESDENDVIIISVELPSEEKVKLAEQYLLPPFFYNYETRPSCPGCRGCVDQLEGRYSPTPVGSAANDKESGGSGGSRTREVGDREEGEEEREDEKEGKKSGTAMFRGSHEGSSFSSLAASATSGGGFWGQKDSSFTGFKGAGAQLFSSKPPNTEDKNYNPEAEIDVNFRPIVTLEAVATKTGEEGEECLFSHRAKLYRFDTKLGQWKERGVGDVKILKNTATGRSRVLMRRDQILKICCNHFITPDMTLQTTAGNAKSWSWQTLSDFAEETAREEMLSIKFKHVEKATEFGEVFKTCQVVSEHGSESEPEARRSREITPKAESGDRGTQNTESAEASSSSSLTCKSLRGMLAPAGAGSVGLEKHEKEGDDQIMTGAEGAGAGEQVEPNDRDGNI